MRHNKIFAFSLSLLAVQCRQGSNDFLKAPKENVSSGDTIAVTKFSIQRSNTLDPKKWIVYSIYSDTICLPKNWKYKVRGDSLFEAFLDTNGFLSYEILPIKNNTDSIAKIFRKTSIEGYAITKQDLLKKNIFNESILYESYPIINNNRENYFLGIILLKNNYTIHKLVIKLSKNYCKNNNLSISDIINNIKINGKYFFNENDKIKTIIIL